ncbi:MAG: Uma2 family endonuclease [Deltaproteobacteria bacterium]|nr:Uma2 family endonuclease [Deltaproteobacteria bacterium]
MQSVAAHSRPALVEGPWTWEDFVALPDDDRRELIDGHLLECDTPTDIDEIIAAEIVRVLGNWAYDHGGTVMTSAYKVRVSGKRGVMPDVQYYRPGRRTQRQALTEGAPDLAVEVISPSSRAIDRVTKLNYYRQIGVPEYWIVDPEARTVSAFVLRDGHYLVAEQAAWPPEADEGDDGCFRPARFDGLVIALERLFAQVAEGDGTEP